MAGKLTTHILDTAKGRPVPRQADLPAACRGQAAAFAMLARRSRYSDQGARTVPSSPARRS